MHLTLADMLRTMTVIVDEECPIKKHDAIDTMVQSAVWSLRTTISTVTNISPGMAVFGRDMIFNFKMRVNWNQVEKKRDQVARRDNLRENSKRLPYVRIYRGRENPNCKQKVREKQETQCTYERAIHNSSDQQKRYSSN